MHELKSARYYELMHFSGISYFEKMFKSVLVHGNIRSKSHHYCLDLQWIWQSL